MKKIKTDWFTVTVNSSGDFSSFVDHVTETAYLPKGQRAPILTVRSGGKDILPTGLIWREGDASFALSYDGVDVTVEVTVEIKPTHLTFELISVTPKTAVELVSWGPYPTTIRETIGETVGVVRNGIFAIGIQALNAKTLGGIPSREDDVMPSYDIFDGDDYSDMSQDSEEKQLYRGETAVATPHGSQLQAYCRDRSESRIIENWGHEKYVAPAYEDGGVIGSKIALFGCPAAGIMDVVGAIELAEGLPHPTIDGGWAKTSSEATASYIIMDFGEEDIDRAIAVTRAAGLSYLYHSSPFETWGHFALKKDQFPNGWMGFKTCVEKAAEFDIKLGIHTLSNFTTTNDPYVTPRPDPRLARIGSSQLTKAIGATVKTIPIDDPDFFRKKTTLNTIIIDDELISYKRVSAIAPWKLLHCTRGAFGTEAVAHDAGTVVGKLLDHSYRVFLTDADLAREQAHRIADFCNQTGAMQLSFDGLEGNWSTGMGQYGRTLFTLAWYEKLAPELRGRVINDASNPGHFSWHIYTRMNWGEPWYAGFRESQTLYRLKNQNYYSRNLMPRMLGWFALRDDTSIEDTEWLLARAAGFDAGFSLATSVQFAGDQILPGNDIQDRGRQHDLQAILGAIREWETARMTGVFPEELKPELQDVENEFHLERVGEGRWQLFRVHSVKAKLHAGKRTITFDNPHERQPLRFILQNVGEKPIEGLTLTVGKERVLLCKKPVPAQGILKFNGGGEAMLYGLDPEDTVRLDFPVEDLIASTGSQKLVLDWANRQVGQGVRVEYRTLGEPMELEKGD